LGAAGALPLLPAGFPEPLTPQENPLTPEKVALGKLLFSEADSLSTTGSRVRAATSLSAILPTVCRALWEPWATNCPSIRPRF